MRIHELKTWPEAFLGIWQDRLHHTLRKNDRDYQEHDRLILREYDPELLYCGRVVVVSVESITREHEGLCNGFLVMSIRVLAKGSDGNGPHAASWARKVAQSA